MHYTLLMASGTRALDSNPMAYGVACPSRVICSSLKTRKYITSIEKF